MKDMSNQTAGLLMVAIIIVTVIFLSVSIKSCILENSKIKYQKGVQSESSQK